MMVDVGAVVVGRAMMIAQNMGVIFHYTPFNYKSFDRVKEGC